MRAVQFLLSCVIGCATFVTLPHDTPRTLLSAFMGVAGLIAVTKIYVWLRHGKEAAQSLTLDG